MHFVDCDTRVIDLVRHHADRFQLPTAHLWVTSDRATYGRWIRRRIPASYGGAYCRLRTSAEHVVLVNLGRIDLDRPRALEIVVVEELLHMRDNLDGDLRRHAHHGHDRVARRVAAIVGVSMEEVRAALKPTQRRPVRYRYRCPECGLEVPRRRRGTWSCGRCSPRFDRRFVLTIVEEYGPGDNF